MAVSPVVLIQLGQFLHYASFNYSPVRVIGQDFALSKYFNYYSNICSMLNDTRTVSAGNQQLTFWPVYKLQMWPR